MGQIHSEVYEEFGNPLGYVSVCTPDHLHAVHTIPALRRGEKVFSEKPICTTSAELGIIRRLVTYGSGSLGCNFPLRFQLCFQMLKADIEAAKFGEVYYCEATYHWGRRGKLDTTWRAEDPEYSYMLGGGIHMIDCVKWLFGGRIKALGPAVTTDALQVGTISVEGAGICHVVADFGSDRGDHWHEIRIRGTEASLTVQNRTETDKKAALRAFISGNPTPNSSEIMEVMACALTLAGK